MSVGEKIKEIRKKLGLTQKSLSTKAEIGLASLQRYESDERSPNLEALEKIADALGVDVGEFLPHIELPISSNFIHYRNKSDLSIKELSQKTGISVERIMEIESENGKATETETALIADVLGVDGPTLQTPIMVSKADCVRIKKVYEGQNVVDSLHNMLAKQMHRNRTISRELAKNDLARDELFKSPIDELIKNDLRREELLNREFTKEELEEDLLSEIMYWLEKINYDGKIKVVEYMELLAKVPEYQNHQ